jgi:hypothetical protein
MKFRKLNAMLAALAFLASGTAAADFGVGAKVGTLGLGLEGRWNPPVPWFDLRIGVNSYDYSDKAGYAGVDYDATLALDSYYLTTNFKFPASPFRLTLGAFSNGNEVQLTSEDMGGINFAIGGTSFSAADVGTLEGVVSFSSTSPYLGVGFDFELFGKAGLNLDFGVLWQGEPTITLEASGLDAAPAQIQTTLGQALEIERAELEEEMSNLKAWPVVSLAFVYNF